MSAQDGRLRNAEYLAALNAEPLQVDVVAAASVSLGECVRHAVSEYFRVLDGQRCEGLYRVAIAQVEAPLFEVVLQQVGGNHSRAAKVLGISRATLRDRLRKYGLDQSKP